MYVIKKSIRLSHRIYIFYSSAFRSRLYHLLRTGSQFRRTPIHIRMENRLFKKQLRNFPLSKQNNVNRARIYLFNEITSHEFNPIFKSEISFRERLFTTLRFTGIYLGFELQFVVYERKYLRRHRHDSIHRDRRS